MNDKVFGFNPESTLPDHPRIKDKREALKKLIISPLLDSDMLLDLLNGKIHFLSEAKLDYIFEKVDHNLRESQDVLRNLSKEDIKESEEFVSLMTELDDIEQATQEKFTISDYSAISETFSITLIDLLSDARKLEIISPASIYEFLDSYVIGQHMAKMQISNVIYSHALKSGLLGKPCKFIPKQNLLILGPSGTGKSFLCEIGFKKLLGLPIVMADGSSMVSTGIYGNSIETILTLLQSNNSLEWAQKGVVFIDEIDKMPSRLYDQLLTSMQGTVFYVPKNLDYPKHEYVSFDTTNLTFVFAGSFSKGLEKTIEKRLGLKQIGFNKNTTVKKSVLNYTINEDLVSFLPKELIGRISSITILEPLVKQDLIDILLKSNSSIYYKWVEFFRFHDINLSIELFAISAIADFVANSDCSFGARQLEQILSEILKDYVFNISSLRNSTIVIDKDEVIRKLNYSK